MNLVNFIWALYILGKIASVAIGNFAKFCIYHLDFETLTVYSMSVMVENDYLIQVLRSLARNKYQH